MEEEGQQRWTADQVLALAPDASSRKAGAKLAAPAPWSGTGAAGPAVWGLCAGSGSNPYRTVIDTAGPGYKCSCPSRKFPCKHALGLLLLWSGGAVGPATPDSPPDWVAEWLDARRSRELATQDRPATGAVADPAAARQRAERRAQRV
ncbi:SWIM zinc finger family protein, partial [Actinacidiphila soli]|uniref:SWIM zinc finger family protein n=1 Tax=Actinacidiphila soli TaxID=2487275 RepID=UPI0019CF5674